MTNGFMLQQNYVVVPSADAECQIITWRVYVMDAIVWKSDRNGRRGIIQSVPCAKALPSEAPQTGRAVKPLIGEPETRSETDVPIGSNWCERGT
jgi:hypothetical protein